MKNGQIFWGSLFITLGALILGTKFNIINSDWEFIGNLWPLIFIFWGLLVITKNTIFKPVLSGLFGFLISLLIYGSIYYVFDGVSTTFEEDFNSGNYSTNYFKTDYDSKVKYGNLEIKTGAASIRIQDTTSNLVDGHTKSTWGNYFFDTRISDSTAWVEFSNEGSHEFHFRDKIRNNINIKLNSNIIWDFRLDIGAAKTNLDLSKYLVRNIELNTGASSNVIKLGDKSDRTYINVEMGAASLKIRIPKESGCRIDGDLVLSSNNLKTFVKINNNIYESKNYNSAAKKVLITIDGGVSKFNVETY